MTIVVLNPKDKVFTIINYQVYSAEVIYVMKGTSTIKARIKGDETTTKFLKYEKDFFMTKIKADKVCSSLRQAEYKQFEDYIRKVTKKDFTKDVVTADIKQTNTFAKNSFATSICNSCGVILDNLGRCRCSN